MEISGILMFHAVQTSTDGAALIPPPLLHITTADVIWKRPGWEFHNVKAKMIVYREVY